MLITHKPHNKSLIPVLAYRDKIESMWQINEDQYLSKYDSPPCCGWFSFENGYPYIFHIADCIVIDISGQKAIKFWNGRHRTRWILDHTDLNLIPIGIREEYIELAISEGLINRNIDKNEQVAIYWEPTYIDFSKNVRR